MNVDKSSFSAETNNEHTTWQIKMWKEFKLE